MSSRSIPVSPIAHPWLCLAVLLIPLISSGWAQRLPPTKGTLPLTYVIDRTDRLRVEVYQEDDLSLITRVDAQGSINLPLVGEVPVRGKTIQEAQRLVELAYMEGRYLKSPKVTINVEEYAPREVSVHGQVRNQGRIPLPVESTITIVDAIMKAGGFTDTAKGSAVILTRLDENDVKLKIPPINVEAMMGGAAYPDVPAEAKKLVPGDIINVPERRF